jgi:hypothetical protein
VTAFLRLTRVPIQRAAWAIRQFELENRYNENPYLQLTQAYIPLNLGTDCRTCRDLHGDDIAQDNEIGPSNNRNLGTVGMPNRVPDPNLKRPYAWEYTAGVQHS